MIPRIAPDPPRSDLRRPVIGQLLERNAQHQSCAQAARTIRISQIFLHKYTTLRRKELTFGQIQHRFYIIQTHFYIKIIARS